MSYYMTGVFPDDQTLMAAAKRARREGVRIHDAFTPYPIHGIDPVIGIRRSRLPWVCLAAGVVGGGFALWLQIWTSAVDWPLIVGGKPFNSLPAFVPVTFEVTVLSAGIITFLTLWARSRLWPGKRFSLPVKGVTDDRFALVLEARDAGFDADAARRLLLEEGAVEVVTSGGGDYARG